MASRMREHFDESQEQARRLEELLAALDTSHSTVTDTMVSIAGNVAALLHTPAPDEVIKNTLANYASNILNRGLQVASRSCRASRGP
jgi:ferritin-like metal-binding protein YciE